MRRSIADITRKRPAPDRRSSVGLQPVKCVTYKGKKIWRQNISQTSYIKKKIIQNEFTRIQISWHIKQIM